MSEPTLADVDAVLAHIYVTAPNALLMSAISRQLDQDVTVLLADPDTRTAFWGYQNPDGDGWTVEHLTAVEAVERLESGDCWSAWERILGGPDAYADWPDPSGERAADEAVVEELLQLRLLALPENPEAANRQILHEVETHRVGMRIAGYVRAALVRAQDDGTRGWQARAARQFEISTKAVSQLANRRPGQPDGER